MILTVQCPHCGQQHGIYITPQILQGIPLKTVCPITHQEYLVKISVSVQALEAMTKKDIEAAEEQARFEDQQWYAEEDAYFGDHKDK